MSVELLFDARAQIGESPTWVSGEQAIYWIDVKAPALYCMTLSGALTRQWALPSEVGAFALVQTEAAQPDAIVALRDGLFRLQTPEGELTQLAEPPFDPARTRFNEGACDAAGRFWVGTMFDPLPGVSTEPLAAALHSFTLSGGLRRERDAADLHNGMAWSPDGSTFYLSHSYRGDVYAFLFDAATGQLGPRRTFTRVQGGIPDGAAVDCEGGYWCAVHGGWQVRRYRADGSLDRTVPVPVSQPTMCAFAGAELDLMLVTSAADSLSAAALHDEPHAGGIFCFRPGIRGVMRPCFVR